MNVASTGLIGEIPTDLAAAALALSPPHRAALADALLASLEGSGIAPHPGWPEDWAEELDRRSSATERGATLSQGEFELRRAELLGRERGAGAKDPRP